MINKPTTRDQAIQNAILAAEESYASIQRNSTRYPATTAALAQAWAEIAALMPEVTLMSKFVDGLTHKEAKVIQGLRNGDTVTVRPDWVKEANEAIAYKNRADNNVTFSVSPREREIIKRLREGEVVTIEPSVLSELRKQEVEVFGPGETVHTHDENGKPLKFTVMRNGDLVLEDGERDISRTMVEGAGDVAVEPVKRRIPAEGRVSRVMTGAPITQDAVRILRAIVAAKIIHSTEGVHKMAVTDVDRYAKESLTVTVTPSHYEVTVEYPA